MTLLLGRAHCLARNLERVGVVAHDGQLVGTAQGHTSCHVKVTAHVAAGVALAVLVLVHLEDDGAPASIQHEVCEGALRLRLQTAAAEGQVVLVLVLALRQCLGVIAVEGAHVIA